MTGSAEFHIGRRGGVCASCSAALAPGTPVSSVICRGDGETAFERRDFCAACFADGTKHADAFSWWTAVVPTPEVKKAVFDTAVAKEFLLRLLREDAPERASLRYLLTLLLLRKKHVKVTDQFLRDGKDIMVLTVPPDETVFEVPCVELGEAEAEKLREELGRLFAL